MAGQRSNQLNYVPTRQINNMRNRQCLCGFAQIAYRALIAFPCLKERSYRRNRPQIPERTTVLPKTIRADGREENKGKRTSQKHPNSFPSSGKGCVAVFDGSAIRIAYGSHRASVLQ
jgi:hypothetical protein